MVHLVLHMSAHIICHADSQIYVWWCAICVKMCVVECLETMFVCEYVICVERGDCFAYVFHILDECAYVWKLHTEQTKLEKRSEQTNEKVERPINQVREMIYTDRGTTGVALVGPETNN